MATARDGASSMVNASRDQSTESPRRRICSMISPPYCSFHSHTRATNASRPRSWRVLPSFLRSASTTFWVAMPAWSVPGSHSVVDAFHALPADDHVLQRVVEHVPERQAPRHVRRREEHRERALAGLAHGREAAVARPPFVPARLDLARVVGPVEPLAGRGADLRPGPRQGGGRGGGRGGFERGSLFHPSSQKWSGRRGVRPPPACGVQAQVGPQDSTRHAVRPRRRASPTALQFA